MKAIRPLDWFLAMALGACAVMACSSGEQSMRAPEEGTTTVESEVAAPAMAAPPPPAAGAAESADSERLERLASLLDGLGQGEAAELADLARGITSGDTKDPLWPIFQYVSAEVLTKAGAEQEALERHRRLTEWAAADPYGDAWGGSGLAVVSLWRWASMLDGREQVEPAEVDRLIAASEKLWRYRRLGEAMFRFSYLDSLPRLEEDIYRLLALLAARVGNHDRAHPLLVKYLERSPDEVLGPEERKLEEHLQAEKWASPAELGLIRGKNLFDLRLYDLAYKELAALRDTEDGAIRAEANLTLARLLRQTRRDEYKLNPAKSVRENVDGYLQKALAEARRPDLIQEALLLRAVNYNRPGSERDPGIVLESLNEIADGFPNGTKADDAIYQLASFYQDRFAAEGDRGDRDEALRQFQRLREFEGENDWLNLSHFRPALLLFAGGEVDRRESARLLTELRKVVPDGPLDRSARFWLGRLAEDGRQAEARKWFRDLIEDNPWDYYAIRARMHLQSDADAAGRPHPTGAARGELIEGMKASEPVGEISGSSPYHRRLVASLKSGLYQMLLGRRNTLRESIEARLQVLPLADLDSDGRLSRLAVLLALRQDAMAAKDSGSGGRNHLQIQAALADAGDWSLAALLAVHREYRYTEGRPTETERGFLAAAYPPIDAVFGPKLELRAEAARWRVQPTFLYAVARRESLFDAAAWSQDAAIGYFQVTKGLFESLNGPGGGFRWALLERSGKASRELYLLTPKLSVEFASRYLGDYLLPRNDHDLFRSIIEHNAGAGVLKRWDKGWKRLGMLGDLEYKVDSVRYLETRLLLRGVLTDYWLMEANAAAAAEAVEAGGEG